MHALVQASRIFSCWYEAKRKVQTAADLKGLRGGPV